MIKHALTNYYRWNAKHCAIAENIQVYEMFQAHALLGPAEVPSMYDKRFNVTPHELRLAVKGNKHKKEGFYCQTHLPFDTPKT